VQPCNRPTVQPCSRSKLHTLVIRATAGSTLYRYAGLRGWIEAEGTHTHLTRGRSFCTAAGSEGIACTPYFQRSHWMPVSCSRPFVSLRKASSVLLAVTARIQDFSYNEEGVWAPILLPAPILVLTCPQQRALQHRALQ
jgi:hypothetical protein